MGRKGRCVNPAVVRSLCRKFRRCWIAVFVWGVLGAAASVMMIIMCLLFISVRLVDI